MDLVPLRGKTVAVLPDLYVDALCPLPAWPEARRRLDALASRGGGNLPVGPVRVKLGGNAANLALALARLGAQVELLARADPLGLHLLERAARGTALGISRVRSVPAGSATVALECAAPARSSAARPGTLRANLMLSHAGPLADFGPDSLSDDDWSCIGSADAVAVVNWAQNPRGTRLLEAAAQHLEGRRSVLFFDAGDPRHRGAEARRLVQRHAWWTRVGSFGLNENELSAFSGRPLGEDELEDAASGLAQRLGTRVDFHCRQWAASAGPDGRTVRVKALAPPGLHATGAGDAWNAGNIAGELLGWPARERLRLAHRVATHYVTSPQGLPPTAKQLQPRGRRDRDAGARTRGLVAA